MISFFSADPNRHYDMMDLGMAQALAHRTSIAVENGRLLQPVRSPQSAVGQHPCDRPSDEPWPDVSWRSTRRLKRFSRERRKAAHESAIHATVEESEPTQGPSEAVSVVAKGRRILIVEDNVGTAKVLSRLLARLGSHEVHVVHDGLTALDAATKHHPEIVLLDIGLPRMNGYEVAMHLRRQPEFQDTLLSSL